MKTKSRKNTKPRGRFQNQPLADQVRFALPVAREAIAVTLDAGSDGDDYIVARVAAVLGGAHGPRLLTEYRDANEEDSADIWDRLEAAQAFGIALGLMLNRDAFLERGVR